MKKHQLIKEGGSGSCSITIEDNGESKESKIWSIWGDSFGEVNAYKLDFTSAKRMANEIAEEGDFEYLTIYCPTYNQNKKDLK